MTLQKSGAVNNAPWPRANQIGMAVVALTMLVIAEDGTELRPTTWAIGVNVGLAISNWKRKHRELKMVGYTVVTDCHKAANHKPDEVQIKRWPRTPKKPVVKIASPAVAA